MSVAPTTETHAAASPPLDVEPGLGLLALLSQGVTVGSLSGLSPRVVESFYALGYGWFNAGRLADAERVFALVAMQDHLDRRYQLALAMTLHAQGRHERALRPYGMASLLDLTDPEPVLRMAECLLSLGRKDEARLSLQQALEQARARPQQHEAAGRRAQTILELMGADAALSKASE